MAERIEWLNELPLELQEKILEYIEDVNSPLSLHPIEIDGVVYKVPMPVIDLVDSLWTQLRGNGIAERVSE